MTQFNMIKNSINQKKIRVLHCPDNVAGNAQMIVNEERRLGLSSWLVSFNKTRFEYRCDEVLFGRSRILNEIKRWLLLIRAILFYDIIHYNFGSTIFPQRLSSNYIYSKNNLINYLFKKYVSIMEQKDMVFLKLIGKKIFITYQGDDARQGDYCMKNFKYSFVEEAGYYSTETDQYKRERIVRVSRYANKIFSLNPDLLNVLPSNSVFIPYAHIQLNEWLPKYPSESVEIPHIVHAPSHRGVKGTKHILAALEKLKAEGFNFRYTLVENMTHNDAKKIYETADLLIDQLFVGWYGGLAVELMALGKPVMCYIRENDLQFLSTKMRSEIPIININIDNIYEKLKFFLVNKSALRAFGKASRKYVETWHNPQKIIFDIFEFYKNY